MLLGPRLCRLPALIGGSIVGDNDFPWLVELLVDQGLELLFQPGHCVMYRDDHADHFHNHQVTGCTAAAAPASGTRLLLTETSWRDAVRSDATVHYTGKAVAALLGVILVS